MKYQFGNRREPDEISVWEIQESLMEYHFREYRRAR